MIVTLSPAKLLDFSTPVEIDEKTSPFFKEESEELISQMKQYTIEEVGDLMGVNPKQAMDVYQYIQSFDMDRTVMRQAAFAYNGIAYKGLESYSFTRDDWEFAQEHLIIMSALYGALKPLDAIKPYRLDMTTKLENSSGGSLYEFWQPKITKYLSSRLIADDLTWVNVTSNEYFKVPNKKQLPKGTRIITATFKQDTSQGVKMQIVHAKKARGMMARFIIKNKLEKVEDIKLFDYEGYSFTPTLSSENEWLFTR